MSGEDLEQALQLIYAEYEQALTLQDALVTHSPEEGYVIEELKMRLNFNQARAAAERVDLSQENVPKEDVDAVFNFGSCVTAVLEYCRSTAEEIESN